MLPLPGMYDHTALLDVIAGLGASTSKPTRGDLLNPNGGVVGPDGTGFLGPIGGMTLGRASIASVLDLLLPKDATGTVSGGATTNSTLFDDLSALGL